MLKGLGLAGLVPLLPSELASANGSAPKRLVIVVFPNGAEPSFFPTSGSTPGDFELGWIGEDLQPYKDRISIVGGTYVAGTSHHSGGHWVGSQLLTGGRSYGAEAQGPSIDHIVARRVSSELGRDVRPLTLGIQDRTDQPIWRRRMSWTDAGSADTPFLSPGAAADAVFGEYVPSDDGSLRRRIDVLDRVRSDLDRFRRNLDLEDRTYLDSHLDAVGGLHSQLGEASAVDCSSPMVARGLANRGNEDFPVLTESYLQILATALRCDAVRVSTLFFGDTQGGSNMQYPWLAGPSADYPWIPESHPQLASAGDHGIAHPCSGGICSRARTEAERMRKSIRDRWWVSRLARFLELLDVLEGDATVLDNTIVLFMSTMQDGDRHTTDNLPIVVAGGGCGALRTGQYVDYGRGEIPQTRLLATLSHAMGYPLSSFGTAGGSIEPLDELLL